MAWVPLELDSSHQPLNPKPYTLNFMFFPLTPACKKLVFPKKPKFHLEFADFLEVFGF